MELKPAATPAWRLAAIRGADKDGLLFKVAVLGGSWVGSFALEGRRRVTLSIAPSEAAFHTNFVGGVGTGLVLALG